MAAYNDHLPVILVAPLTSGSRPAPFHVTTTFQGKAGLMLLDQIRAVDARRLVRNVGQLDRMTLSAALGVLRSLFAEWGADVPARRFTAPPAPG